MTEESQKPQAGAAEQPPLREITPEQLKEILAQHQKWVETGEKEGTRADLSRANLQGAGLRGANLQRAHLWEANLQGARLALANLQKADPTGALLDIQLRQQLEAMDAARFAG